MGQVEGVLLVSITHTVTKAFLVSVNDNHMDWLYIYHRCNKFILLYY